MTLEPLRMPASKQSEAAILDVLNQPRLQPLQIRVFLICAAVALLDGIDNQSIGVAAPMMAPELGLNPTELGVIFSVAQVGATMGALGFGPFADRFGRKPAIFIATAIIALFTWLTAMSAGFGSLLAVRFMAGIGLAGAVPCILALSSEYAPLRLRGTMVSLIFAAYPLGAAIGGVLNAYLLANFTWHAVFYVGALLPLVMLIIIILFLPESIQFLLSRGGNEERIEKLARQLSGRAPVATPHLPPPAIMGSTPKPKGLRFGSLFAGGLVSATLLLWLIYFFTYATTKIMVVWLPSLLKEDGFDVPTAALVISAFNIGCTVGMAIAGRLVDRFGWGWTLAPALLIGAICVAALGLVGANTAAVMIIAALIGFFVGIGGSGAHAVAATLYPTEIRSTGIGCGMAASRFGQVISPVVVGAMLTAALSPKTIYLLLALMPLTAAVFAIFIGLNQRRRARASVEGPLSTKSA
jgi:AAHS family 4-hydroxybenzoate transporter-like MFS transporter